MPAHRTVRVVPFRDDEGWLEPTKVRPPEQTPCCPKCRRGTKAHGILPCGYAALRTGCPNPECKHHRGTPPRAPDPTEGAPDV